ncbi:MAG: translation initiation factor IF-2 [Nitrospiraceae bacterium]|nr:translation initiation factor IF-2 [Nitrospiraceae bacterium]
MSGERVHDLAKKLGMESKELLAELKRLGIAAKSHSSTLDDDAVRTVLAKLDKGTPASKTPAKAEAGKALVRKDTTTRKETAAKSTPAEESPKADKKRLLFKKKKEDEATYESAAALLPMTPIHPAGPMHDSAAVAAPAAESAHAPLSLSGHPPAVSTATPVHEPASGVGGPPVVATTATATAAPGLAPSTMGAPGARKKIDFGQPAGEAGLKDKLLKKTKKTGRVKDEDDLRFREDAARWQDLRAIPVHRREDRSRHQQASTVTEITKPRQKAIKLTAGLTVKEFSELVGQRPADVMRKLMDTGQMLTLNQPLNLDAAQLIAESFGVKTEVVVERQGDALFDEPADAEEGGAMQPRPPVVTIMGHVDHGKTSLLDAIRQTKVAEGEAGGITQHIGAYTVAVHGKQVTFLDTPGHEAFTSMRSRGAKITDLVVLVVAADDGVMPQTVEAIHHATAAGVPIIVAINKIDKPGANSDRVKNALAEHQLIPEAWGGQTIFVEVSAKQKTGIETLLEMILLQADVLEFKADPTRLAKGTVIEARLDRGRGPVATILVQGGTLRIGDAFVVGTFSGRVRALNNDRGEKVKEAGPSVPVEVIGLPGVPGAGDVFVVVKDERVAREIADTRAQKQRAADINAGPGKVTLDDLFARIKEGAVKELAVVIKADVQGSAEALGSAVEKLSTDAVKLRVIHSGVGAITETDIMLATASRAIVIGFNIRPEPKAAALAEKDGIDVRLYTIIYKAIEDIRAAMEGLLEPTLKERVLGRLEVRQVFTIPKAGVIAGCYVTDGTIQRSGANVRVLRDNVSVYQGKMGSLRRFKDDVKEVQQGYECGMSVENFNDIKVGDVLEVFAVDKIATKL